MSVNPGFSGQQFIAGSVPKIAAVRAVLDRAGNAAAIEVDGGIQAGNAARVVAAGADILVAGAAIFGTDDPAARDAPPAAGSRRGAAGPANDLVADCSSTVRVRYAETDKMGVAYHANFFVWFEVARCDLLAVARRRLPRPGGTRRDAARDRGALHVPHAGAL